MIIILGRVGKSDSVKYVIVFEVTVIFLYSLGTFNRIPGTKGQPYIADYLLSYDVAVIQWITSCYKNRMTTRVITLWRIHVT